MSHFYGSMQGSRGVATRCGTKKSGMTAHVRGWDIGARIICTVNEKGEDCIGIELTSGSNGRKRSLYLGTFKEVPDSYWEEDVDYPVADWVFEVNNNDTRLGYLRWVAAQKEAIK